MAALRPLTHRVTALRLRAILGAALKLATREAADVITADRLRAEAIDGVTAIVRARGAALARVFVTEPISTTVTWRCTSRAIRTAGAAIIRAALACLAPSAHAIFADVWARATLVGAALAGVPRTAHPVTAKPTIRTTGPVEQRRAAIRWTAEAALGELADPVSAGERTIIAVLRARRTGLKGRLTLPIAARHIPIRGGAAIRRAGVTGLNIAAEPVATEPIAGVARVPVASTARRADPRGRQHLAGLGPPRVRDGRVKGRAAGRLNGTDASVAVSTFTPRACVVRPATIRVGIARVVFDGVATVDVAVEAIFASVADIITAGRWAGAAVLRTATAMLTSLT